MGSSVGIPAKTAAIEAELQLSIAKLELFQFDLAAPVESLLHENDAYRLDLSLTPRLADSRFSFCERWSAQRFEPAGKLFVLPPGQPLRVRSGVGRQGALICHLIAEPIREWFDSDFEWTDQRLVASLDVGSLSIRTLLLQLTEEIRRPGFASEILCEALVAQIAVNLQRYYLGIEQRKALGTLAPWRLRLIDERLMDQDGAPTLSELAALCNISVRQLSRGFRASRGISIGEYVAQRCLENAERLLTDGVSVKSVAYSLGFSSPSSFCYAFRKSTGCTPGQYRQRAGITH